MYSLGKSGLNNHDPGTPATVASGVAFYFPLGQEYMSFRTGDEGWRIQNGFYVYTRPVYPAVTAELDTSLGSNYWWRLKSALKVGGVSNVIRFVDVDGGQTWSSTGNKDRITIDKLTGLGFYRLTADLGGAKTWNNAIDGALTFSTVVNGVTYQDWYLISREEILLILGEISENGPGNIEDPVSIKTIFNKNGASNELWTATIQMNSGGANAYSKGWNPSTYIRGSGIASTFPPMIVFDAKSLITAP